MREGGVAKTPGITKKQRLRVNDYLFLSTGERRRVGKGALLRPRGQNRACHSPSTDGRERPDGPPV